MKKCSKCKQLKNKSEFCKDRTKKDGLHSWCKFCRSKSDKKYREQNIEELRRKGRDNYIKNSENIKKKQKYRYANDEEYRKRVKKSNKKSYEKNRKKRILSSKEYRKNNKKKRNENEKKRKLIDPRYKLRCSISSMINKKLNKRLLSKNGKSTFNGILPYTPKELKQHLENQFQEGMTWENHKHFGWHIDHIIPDCKFNYKSVEDEEFQRCWALSNLQPLWWQDNLRKNKVNYEK